jgi:hypothetical protein
VVKVVLDLVYDFVTLPITKDESLLKKIIEMVAKEFEKGLNIFSNEMFSHEGLITEMHFKKLQILA